MPDYMRLGRRRAAPFIMLDEIFALLCESPTFQACILRGPVDLLLFVPVAWADLALCDGGDFNSISLLMRLNKNIIAAVGVPGLTHTAAHEYRHAWQLGSGVLKSIFARFADQQAHTRLIEADAVAFQLTVAAELYRAGHKAMLQDVEELFGIVFPECTVAFLQSIAHDRANLWNGEAQNAVLRAWRLSRADTDYYGRSGVQLYKQFQSLRGDIRRRVDQTAPNGDALQTHLFRMPYRAPDGTIMERRRYGRLPVTVWKQMHSTPSARGRLLDRRMDDWTRAQRKAKPVTPV